MKLVKVLIPFRDKKSKKLYKQNDEIELTEKRIEEIRKINVNMITVLGDVKEPPKEPELPKEPEPPENPETPKEPEAGEPENGSEE